MNNIFSKLPTDLSEEVFEKIVASDTVLIERIISKGHHSIDWYDQEKSEWVMVLSGSAVIEFDYDDLKEQKFITLNKGDYLNIPAHQKHRVASTNVDIETVWLAVHY